MEEKIIDEKIEDEIKYTIVYRNEQILIAFAVKDGEEE